MEDLKDSKTGSNNRIKTGHKKKQKKILPTSRWKIHKNIPATRCKGSKTILEQNIKIERT